MRFKGKMKGGLFIFCLLFCCNFNALTVSSCQLTAASEGAAYTCVMDAESRRILYAENADVRMPMASTTKVLTAITVLENCQDVLEEVEIMPEAVGIEGSSLYLKAGEKYTVKDLLYGLMLRSGNDAAVALALHTQGDSDRFCVKMNEIAQKSGALHSNFVNPHGLPEKNHYTTATDLSLITCYAMENPLFVEIVSTKFYEPRNWHNKNKLLKTYEGAIGVKTGYTKQAGRCLVAAAKREDMTLVCTLLNCANDFEKAKILFDDTFKAYKSQLIFSKKDVFNVDNGYRKIEAHLDKDLYYPLLDAEKEHLSYEIMPYLEKKADGSVGQIEIMLANHLIFSEKLYKL